MHQGSLIQRQSAQQVQHCLIVSGAAQCIILMLTQCFLYDQPTFQLMTQTVHVAAHFSLSHLGWSLQMLYPEQIAHCSCSRYYPPDKDTMIYACFLIIQRLLQLMQ